MKEIKNFSKCRFCGSSTIGIPNNSAFNVFTVKCNTCYKEWDYKNKEQAELAEQADQKELEGQ